MTRPADTPVPSPAELLRCAVEAAQAAGGYALRNHARRREAVRVSRHDVKLALDIESQQVAEETIRAAYPHHAFLGEETDPERADERDGASLRWVVDPIDGTVNFSHGLRQWCCSVAAQIHGRTVAGAVYAPALDELYTATAAGPAQRNGETIRVSQTAELAAATVHTGFDRHPDSALPPLTFIGRIAEAVQRPRVMGSAALDICLVAMGSADAYFEAGIYLWDVAAAGLIVEQAGGATSVPVRYEGHRMAFAASNGLLHQALLRVVGVSPQKTNLAPARG